MSTKIVRALASVLLRYPDESLFADLSTVSDAVAGLPARHRAPLSRFVEHARGVGLGELQRHYVETFDLKRRFCLYLSYYLNGDTRRRGVALVGFKETYRAAGFVPVDGELPDFLPTVLEFAAVAEPAPAERLLIEHRRGLVVLLAALREVGSPYADVVAVVDVTLPAAHGRELDAAAVLAVQGPPVEQVGLEPFGLDRVDPDPGGAPSPGAGASLPGAGASLPGVVRR